MYYRHSMQYDYPDRSDAHMMEVVHQVDTHFDEHFPYLDESFGYKLARAGLWLALNTFVFPVCSMRYGLKISGREHLRANRKLFRDGAITICNHVFRWDYICVMKGIRPHLQYHPGWAGNYEGKDRTMVRLVGGIPIPAGNLPAMKAFSRAMDRLFEKKSWVHFFPEGSLWFYYPDLRPLKPAVFKYAHKYGRPVIPMALSFRPRKGFWRLFDKKDVPCVELHIGQPLLPDPALPLMEDADRIRLEACRVMQAMLGVSPGDPTYNENQNIDEYVKTM
ncbi:MAG: lysophospholipid acyltransferase family protein [Christensenellales bacterium]|jgi:1-acyl-sn-glycerol-3-phosphate acyltransferase